MDDTRIHLTPTGPSECEAKTESGCHYKDGGHFGNMREADEAFALTMGGEIPSAESKPAKIALSSNIGEGIFDDGDLDNGYARAILSSGLCGDLALAIFEKTGGSPYFLSLSSLTPEQLQEDFEKDPDSIFAHTSHIVMESPTEPSHFVDSYGQQTREDFDDYWEPTSVVKGSEEMLRHFADAESSKRLAGFAAAAIELDRRGVSYDYSDLDEYSDDYDDEDDDDYEDDED